MSRTLISAAIAALLCSITSANAVCTSRATSNIILVQFRGCDDSTLPGKIEFDIVDESQEPPTIVPGEAFRDDARHLWIAKTDDVIRIETSKVMPRTSNVRAYCRYGKPVEEPTSATGCGAKYVFACDATRWSLRIAAQPPTGSFPYWRVSPEPTAKPCQEEGLFELPTKIDIGDVGQREMVRVKLVTPDGYFVRFQEITWDLLRSAPKGTLILRDLLRPPGSSAKPPAVLTDTRIADGIKNAKSKNAAQTDLIEVRFSWLPHP
jgi:hypothetical protein